MGAPQSAGDSRSRPLAGVAQRSLGTVTGASAASQLLLRPGREDVVEKQGHGTCLVRGLHLCRSSPSGTSGVWQHVLPGSRCPRARCHPGEQQLNLG